MNAKYGSLFDSQSECSKQDTETKQNPFENKNEQSNDQSYQNRTFQNKCHRNITNNSENTTSEISSAKTSSKTKSEENIDDEKINRENLYHWGATREIMEIIKGRNKSPETRRLVERREALAKPGTMRRRYDTQSQRMIFTPSRPNKRSREESAEIDAELTRRANQIGGGYRPIQVEEEAEEEEEPTGGTRRRRIAGRTKYGRHRGRQCDNAGRQFADCRSKQISHRWQRSPLYPD